MNIDPSNYMELSQDNWDKLRVELIDKTMKQLRTEFNTQIAGEFIEASVPGTIKEELTPKPYDMDLLKD